MALPSEEEHGTAAVNCELRRLCLVSGLRSEDVPLLGQDEQVWVFRSWREMWSRDEQGPHLALHHWGGAEAGTQW